MSTIIRERPAGGDDRLPAHLTPNEGFLLAERGRLVILDLQSPRERYRNGLALGAVATTAELPGLLDEVLEAVDQKRDTPIAVICADGSRSESMRQFLVGQGFSQVSAISEGMTGSLLGPGWVKRKLPLAPRED